MCIYVYYITDYNSYTFERSSLDNTKIDIEKYRLRVIYYELYEQFEFALEEIKQKGNTV